MPTTSVLPEETSCMTARYAKVLVVAATVGVMLVAAVGYAGWRDTLTLLYRLLRLVALFFVH